MSTSDSWRRARRSGGTVHGGQGLMRVSGLLMRRQAGAAAAQHAQAAVQARGLRSGRSHVAEEARGACLLGAA